MVFFNFYDLWQRTLACMHNYCCLRVSMYFSKMLFNFSNDFLTCISSVLANNLTRVLLKTPFSRVMIIDYKECSERKTQTAIRVTKKDRAAFKEYQQNLKQAFSCLPK